MAFVVSERSSNFVRGMHHVSSLLLMPWLFFRSTCSRCSNEMNPELLICPRLKAVQYCSSSVDLNDNMRATHVSVCRARRLLWLALLELSRSQGLEI